MFTTGKLYVPDASPSASQIRSGEACSIYIYSTFFYSFAPCGQPVFTLPLWPGVLQLYISRIHCWITDHTYVPVYPHPHDEFQARRMNMDLSQCMPLLHLIRPQQPFTCAFGCNRACLAIYLMALGLPNTKVRG